MRSRKFGLIIATRRLLPLSPSFRFLARSVCVSEFLSKRNATRLRRIAIYLFGLHWLAGQKNNFPPQKFLARGGFNSRSCKIFAPPRVILRKNMFGAKKSFRKRTHFLIPCLRLARHIPRKFIYLSYLCETIKRI